jgi:hypothetical protein
MASQPGILMLPGGVDAARVRIFLARTLPGRQNVDAAIRTGEALAADTAQHFAERPCSVRVEKRGRRLRITVTAALPPNPAEGAGALPRPMDVVRAETSVYGAVVSQDAGTSSVWAELQLEEDA